MANTRPGRGRTSWFLWVSAAFLASALVTFVFYLAATRRSGAYGNALNLYATFVQLAISVASFVLDRRVGRRPVAGSDPDRLAQTLARIVREAATEAMHQRGLRLPLPLRLRWRVLPTTSGAAATLLPPHLLGAEEDPQWPASGLVDAFRQLTDRRLLVLGEPGAGKSTLALLFTQAAARSADTVPVLLPLASWWPGTESVRDFALRQVPAEYPALAPDGEFDVDAFARLFDDGRVLLVLDGLDELSQAVTPVAIARFNDFAGTDGHPLVITCRTSEYAHAAAAGEPLTGTEVISIEPVTPQDTIGYLAAA
ncbi:MAG TPA: NACHT domain-containing protein, partial [Rugosimonospora sp.]|nr:NACHT domain-containing protein [Rugosimonospora sp.]